METIDLIGGKMDESPVDFEWFRENYDNLTFDEISEFYKILHHHFPDQDYMNCCYFKKMFQYIARDDLTVVELGCNNGGNSKYIVDNVPKIKEWFGYDFKEFDGTSEGKYRFIPLANWFHETEIPKHDVFVVAHALEHLSNEQAIKTLEHVKSDFLLMEVPLKPERQNWKGRWNAHVLTWSINDFDDILSDLGYEIFYDVCGEDSIITGCVRDKLEMSDI